MQLRQLILVPAIILFAITCGKTQDGPDMKEKKEERSQLHAAIMELVDTSCTGDTQCTSIGFGHKPCGGPDEYLIYSLLQTDSETLKTKVYQYNSLDEEIETAEGAMSTCEMEEQPQLVCTDQICVKS